MNQFFSLILSAALLCAFGCRRRSVTPASDASAASAPAPGAPPSGPASPANRAPSGSELPKELQASTPALAQMNLAVEDFVAQMGRPPVRIEELMEKRVLPRLPAASPGKKFVLTKGKNNQTQVAEVSN